MSEEIRNRAALIKLLWINWRDWRTKSRGSESEDAIIFRFYREKKDSEAEAYLASSSFLDFIEYFCSQNETKKVGALPARKQEFPEFLNKRGKGCYVLKDKYVFLLACKKGFARGHIDEEKYEAILKRIPIRRNHVDQHLDSLLSGMILDFFRREGFVAKQEENIETGEEEVKSSTVQKKSIDDIELLNFYCACRGEGNDSAQEGDLGRKGEIGPVKLDEAYKAKCGDLLENLRNSKEETVKGLFLPVFIDEKTGVGLFFVGANYLVSQKKILGKGRSENCDPCVLWIEPVEGLDAGRTDAEVAVIPSYFRCKDIKTAWTEFSDKVTYVMENISVINPEYRSEYGEQFRPYFFEGSDSVEGLDSVDLQEKVDDAYREKEMAAMKGPGTEEEQKEEKQEQYHAHRRETNRIKKNREEK